MSAQATLLRQKIAQLQQEAGLKDIKFLFAPLGEKTLEDVCASINKALDAITAKKFKDLPHLGDGCPKKEGAPA